MTGMRTVLGGALALLALSSAFGQVPSAVGTDSLAPGIVGNAFPAPATGQTPDDKDRLSVNPVTGQTTARASDYAPLTADERWKLYFKQSYWSFGAYFGPLFAALALDQSTGSPRQWGGGFEGYGRRVASRIASGDIVQNSFQFPLAALLKEDVRYIASGQHGFRRRAGHAILYSFVTYNNQGHTTLNVPNIGGYYFAAGVSTLWLPGPQKVWSYTLSNGTESIALNIPVNMLQEFWPEISRKVLRRR